MRRAVDLRRKAYGPVTDPCELDNEHPGFIKSVQFLGKLRDRFSTT